MKSPSNIVRVLVRARWVDFASTSQMRAKAGKVNKSKKKKRESKWILFQVMLCSSIQETAVRAMTHLYGEFGSST